MSLPPDGQPSGSLPPGGQPSGSLPPGGLPTGELPSNGDEPKTACVNSSTLQDHVKNLKKVFKVLRENQLYVKREKCKFAQPKIHFLGHVISQGELRMDEAKKNRPWLWSEECEEAFEGLKAVVTEESVLMLPDFTKTFEIHTDASNFAIGGRNRPANDII
uniref:Reverse transcriptase/retrotransposon-derived protein RNase H-like domain-containing protein n=1 Tax=Solanum lycopersicum TaxID=4081 RepID=A0A3Q7EE47_SOLLC